MPKNIKIDSVCQVFNDGNHNAFTDLCQFNSTYYLTFRNCPDGHQIHSSSYIMILKSKDAKNWESVYKFNVKNRDVRDPHFLVFNEKLFVFSGTWLAEPDITVATKELNDHQGYCVWSEDGQTWHGPNCMEGTQGHYIWRTAMYNNMAYLNGRRKKNFAVTSKGGEEGAIIESVLMQSSDGLRWKTVGLFQESYGDETAFIFEADSSILAIVRSRDTKQPAHVCKSYPPYKEWTRKSLGRNIGGPILVKWGNNYLVGGRKMIDPNSPTTMLYWLVNDKLVEAAELPSGGDNSYPGFVELSPEHGLVSFYSSHEGSGTMLAPSAIYLAQINLTDA